MTYEGGPGCGTDDLESGSPRSCTIRLRIHRRRLTAEGRLSCPGGAAERESPALIALSDGAVPQLVSSRGCPRMDGLVFCFTRGTNNTTWCRGCKICVLCTGAWRVGR